MKKIFVFLGIVLGVVIIGAIFSKQKPTSTTHSPEASSSVKGARLLGIDVNPAPGVDYAAAFTLAKSAGMQFVQLSLFWDDIEPSQGAYVDPGGNLKIADGFYPSQGTKLALTVAPIDTNNNRVPAYLKDKAFNDPAVIQGYEKMMDFVLSRLSHTDVMTLSVGNEVDISLTEKGRQDQYVAFFQAIASYMKQHHPGVKVGVKASFDGYAKNSTDFLQKLNQSSDVILVTHYLVDPTFMVKDPAKIFDSFSSITAQYSKPVYFLELGYPSSETLGSSEEKQKEFINDVFKAWDQYAEKIPVVNFVWMHDISKDTLSGYAKYYGSASANFLAYLGTLGLRTSNGTDKLAFPALEANAHARGW